MPNAAHPVTTGAFKGGVAFAAGVAVEVGFGVLTAGVFATGGAVSTLAVAAVAGGTVAVGSDAAFVADLFALPTIAPQTLRKRTPTPAMTAIAIQMPPDAVRRAYGGDHACP